MLRYRCCGGRAWALPNGIYHLAFFQRPKLDIPTGRGSGRRVLALPQIPRKRGVVDSLPATMYISPMTVLRYRLMLPRADDAPIAIIMHGYRATAMRDTMGLIVLCKKLGYNLLMPDQRAHGRSDSYTITMGAQERYDTRAWAYWASVRSSGKVQLFYGRSIGAGTGLTFRGTFTVIALRLLQRITFLGAHRAGLCRWKSEILAACPDTVDYARPVGKAGADSLQRGLLCPPAA